MAAFLRRDLSHVVLLLLFQLLQSAPEHSELQSPSQALGFGSTLAEFVVCWSMRFFTSGISANRSHTAMETGSSLSPFRTCKQPSEGLGQREILIPCAGKPQEYKPAAWGKPEREAPPKRQNSIAQSRTEEREREEKVPCAGG